MRSERIGLSSRAAVYSLAIKVFSNCSYAALLTALEKDEHFFELAPNWDGNIPGMQTFCRRFGDEMLSEYIEAMIFATARLGAELDQMMIIDSDSIPTVPSGNSRNQKFGPPTPAWRAIATMVKRHFLIGDVTGLVGAIDVTLDVGLGSGDGPHLVSLISKARNIFREATKVLADSAYSQRRNFAEAERLDLELFVPERANEKRLTARKPWPESARRIARLQRDDPERVRRVYRKRSKVEFVPSSSKRRYPYLRLRARKTDRVPQYPNGLKFAKDENDYDHAISKFDEVTIAAIMAAAQDATGCARLNETLMTMLLENLHRLVTLEHLFNQEVDFENRKFAFSGIKLVSESGGYEIKVHEAKRPLDNLSSNVEETTDD
jgi:hypothetical protein